MRLSQFPLASAQREKEDDEAGDEKEALCAGPDQYEPVLERDGGVLLAAARGEGGGVEVRPGGGAGHDDGQAGRSWKLGRGRRQDILLQLRFLILLRKHLFHSKLPKQRNPSKA